LAKLWDLNKIIRPPALSHCIIVKLA